MIERLVAEVEIAGAEPATDMAETALEDASELNSTMGVFQHSGAGARFEQERTGLSISWQFDRMQADTRRDTPATANAVMLEYLGQSIIIGVVMGRLRCLRFRR